ncbi:FANCD2 (predicted) [Pycnogonum litorale]
MNGSSFRKRSHASSTGSGFPSNKKSSKEDVLSDILLRSGFHLSSKVDAANILDVDQATFKKNVSENLEKHENRPSVIDEFISGFESFIRDLERFYSVLQPTSSSDSSSDGKYDSLVRLLLNVCCLQDKLSCCVLHQLAELSVEGMLYFKNVDFTRLVMSQFRWLECLVNGQKLTDKLLEIITVSPSQVQREIISCIPEVLNDEDHATIASHLTSLMTESDDLTEVVLDTMSNLTMSCDLTNEVRSNVLKTLPSIKAQYLPASVKFILQSVQPNDAYNVIMDLRSNLDFAYTFPRMDSSTLLPTASKDDKEIEVLTIGIIRSSIRFRKFMSDAWMKAIDGNLMASDFQVIDVFIMFILHSLSSQKKAVVNLIKNKIRSGCFTEVILQGAFGSPVVMMKELFPSILSLCESLLNSAESCASYIGAIMYKLAFMSTNTYGHQEIIAKLVSHVGSGAAAEVDQALDVLCDLSTRYSGKMSSFSIFIKGILDYVDNLSLSQIRQVYHVLCTLAFSESDNENTMQDELNMIIRKQLSNPVHKYKRMGVVGALMAVRALALSCNDQSDIFSSANMSSDLSTASGKLKDCALPLLEMVKSSTRATPEAMALFYDELADAIISKSLHSKIESWTNEMVATDFLDDFVVDIKFTGETSSIDDYMMSQQYGIDNLEEDGIGMNLLAVILKDKQELLSKHTPSSQQRISVLPVTLASQFRLLQVCELSQQGNLEGIDALLCCPVLLPVNDNSSTFYSQPLHRQHVVCDCLFYTINWFIELANAFVTQKDDKSTIGKVLRRISDIHKLQTQLRSLLSSVRNYRPPTANFVIDVRHDHQLIQSSSGSKMCQKKSKKGTSSDNSKSGSGNKKTETTAEMTVTSTATSIPASRTTQAADDNDEDDDLKTTLPLESLQPFIREFDMAIFDLLHHSCLLLDSSSTQSGTVETEKLLGLNETKMLLGDLSRKLKFILINITAKKNPFGSFNVNAKKVTPSHISIRVPLKVANDVKSLLPVLLDYLDSCNRHFKKVLDDNDGVYDCLGMFNEESETMASVIQSVLNVLSTYLSWNGFHNKENKRLLKESLKVMATRVDQGCKQSSLQTIIKHSIEYLSSYSCTIPNFDCAISLLSILESVQQFVDNKESTNQYLVDVSKSFLQRQWYDTDGSRSKGAHHNQNIQQTLRMYVTYSTGVTFVLESLATGAVSELIEDDSKDASSKSFPTLNRSTFSTYYRLMLSHLVSCIKITTSINQLDVMQQKIDKLKQWSMAVKVFHILVHLIKMFDTRVNLLSCLKYGRLFVELFLKQGMPLLDQLFRNNRENCLNLLKKLQLCTRFIQHICSHSKVTKDISLTNHVPFIRKVLEMLVFRVKAMLAANKCQDAFWLGNLKNRNLQGEEILSQNNKPEESESDENLPDDDDGDVDLESNKSDEKYDNVRSPAYDNSFSDIF